MTITKIKPISSKTKLMERRANILVVDDDWGVQHFISNVLSLGGCQVKAFSNGLDAMDYYAEHSGEVDLVFLDMVMPTVNGISVFEIFRHINPEVRVILCSGYFSAGDPHDLGFVDLLPKPFDVDELLGMVVRHLPE